MNRRSGDRRKRPRFEIVGELRGSLDGLVLPVRNLARGGALLESPLQLPPGSLQWVNVLVDGQPQRMEIRVRHSTAVANDRAPYLIGVEFVTVSSATVEFIQRCIAADSMGATN
jgi:hypothetical protein